MIVNIHVIAATMCLLTIGCGKAVDVDPILQPYFTEFSNAIGADTSDISGQFQALPYPVLGRCDQDKHGNKIILIDPEMWHDMTGETKKTLVFHELGHCALQLSHDTIITWDGCPESIMYPHTIPDKCVVKHRDEYYSVLMQSREAR